MVIFPGTVGCVDCLGPGGQWTDGGRFGPGLWGWVTVFEEGGPDEFRYEHGGSWYVRVRVSCIVTQAFDEEPVEASLAEFYAYSGELITHP